MNRIVFTWIVLLLLLAEIAVIFILPPFVHPVVVLLALVAGMVIAYICWRDLDEQIWDERTARIFEKASVKTLQAIIVLFLLGALFVILAGIVIPDPEVYNAGYDFLINIVFIILTYLIFFAYYSKKLGV